MHPKRFELYGYAKEVLPTFSNSLKIVARKNILGAKSTNHLFPSLLEVSDYVFNTFSPLDM